MAYTVMAHVAMAYIVMAYVGTAYIVMAIVGTACIVIIVQRFANMSRPNRFQVVEGWPCLLDVVCCAGAGEPALAGSEFRV